MWQNIVHAANKEKYSLINRIAIAERASLEEVDRPSHIPPYLFLSREDDDDVRDIGKHDFRSVLLHLMLSNANRCPTANDQYITVKCRREIKNFVNLRIFVIL